MADKHVQLTDIYPPDQINQRIRSWLIWSATNIVIGPDGRLLLIVRSNAEERAIPEPGDLALVGGFNTVVNGPTMFGAVADAHLKAILGLTVQQEQCSDFLPCEYDMENTDGPLNTPFGVLDIKRVAFDRIVLLDEGDVARITPQGKARDIVWMTETEFRHTIAKDGYGGISFPYQIEHVLAGFRFAGQRRVPKVAWV
jgi:hypothetical protein